ncbi:MAG: DUF4258 domain-containing protein [Dehalococcoidia bacterium]|nr:DUF4258 domain-containing protein [Dehalococcoidia bacterium]
MKTLAQIRSQLLAREFNLSQHASMRALERGISNIEIREAGANASVVEEYPDDKYGPTWLLLGFTSAGRPLHMQVSIVDDPLVKLVTIYEPDPDRWWGHTDRR